MYASAPDMADQERKEPRRVLAPRLRSCLPAVRRGCPSSTAATSSPAQRAIRSWQSRPARPVAGALVGAARWRADLVKPNVPYLIERLWTANGQGERLYGGVSPKYTNYDIFRNMVTRLMIRGIDDGWAELTFPDDPLAEDPQYVLTIVDSERFAEGVEKLFPEVDWDEPVSVAVAEVAGAAAPT